MDQNIVRVQIVATVSPKCSVIQVGRFNNYGHPADVVIDLNEGRVGHSPSRL